MSEGIEERLTRLETEVCTLRDREAIRDVLYRYCRAVDRCDVELMKSCYWPDANDTHWFFNGSAHEFSEYVIPDVLMDALASEHAVSNPMIDLANDRAFVECRWNVLHRVALRPGEELHQMGHGRYLDIFARRDGEWRILYRHAVSDGFREFEIPDLMALAPPGSLGRHGAGDPVYEGFDLERLKPEPFKTDDFWGPFLAMHGVGEAAPDLNWSPTTGA